MSPSTIFCLLAVVIGASADGYSDLTLYDVKASVEALEDAINQGFADLSDASTLLAGADERINLISDRLIPAIQTHNKYQESLFDILYQQVSDLQDAADLTAGKLAGTLELASQTTTSIAEVTEYIQDIYDVNEQQIIDLEALRYRIKDVQAELLGDIEAAISTLEEAQKIAEDKLNEAADFIDERKCEYGTASIPPGEYDVAFKVAFSSKPDVSMTLTGFRTRLDLHSYDEYDILALDKHIMDVTTTGFTVTATDASAGMVNIDTVYCVYMACQNLSEDFVSVLPH